MNTITRFQPTSVLSAPRAACGPAPAPDSFVPSCDPEPPTPPTPPEPPPPPPAPEKKKWCVMVYSASDNNLYSFMQSDLDEAERVGSTATMHVVAQTDHGPNDGTVQRLELQKNEDDGVGSPVKADLGSANMSDPQMLADFVKWGMENYPADHYMLVISDHGDGWKGAAQDWSHDGWMSTPDIEAGLRLAREQTGKKIDVLGFDACLMASAEVAYQLKDEVDYLVASQEVEGGAGWEYNRVLSESTLRQLDTQLSSRFNMTPREVAGHIVTCAEGNQEDLATMSAIETAQMPNVARAIDKFADALVTSTVNRETFSNAASNTQGFWDYKDLFDFASKVKDGVQSEDCFLARHADNLMAAVSQAVVAEQHSEDYPNAHGMSIELAHADSEAYGQLKLAQATEWDAAVAHVQSSSR